jgi:hypothetical protein
MLVMGEMVERYADCWWEIQTVQPADFWNYMRLLNLGPNVEQLQMPVSYLSQN